MKILHFISSPAAGGAETYVRDLAILMRKKGHEAHIVFLQTAAESGRDVEFEGKFLDSLSAEAISYSFVGKDARRKPWLGGFRLRKIVYSFKPDIIHCHLYYALLFSFFIFKIPVIYTHHNFKLGLPKFFYRLFDQKVSAYIGICNACRNLLEGPRRRVVQINNGVSKARVSVLKKEEMLPSEVVNCVFVGSLCPQKNLTLMLNAFGSIPERNFRLLVVGEGPDREKLERHTLAVGIDKKVEFLGNISNVSEILANSDIFLMSSAWEGLPIALIEATLTGLPVIVTNVGGSAEVVHQCANGFVVDSLGIDDYSNALIKMIEDFELRAWFSKNALSFSSLYEIERSADQHLKLYQEVVSADCSSV